MTTQVTDATQGTVDLPELEKIQWVADLLQCSTQHVRRLIASEGLPARDIGCGKSAEWRFERGAVVEWLRSRCCGDGAAA